ncbi:MAG: hypothetical protein COA94_08700 [Rickettsiales bacterium]|nr:MAG: hypothetical protein COA94_08700 [Rickettsiales bacterium]
MDVLECNVNKITQMVGIPVVIKPVDAKRGNVLFIGTNDGHIFYVDESSKKKTLLDLRNVIKTPSFCKMGLLGLAFHEDFDKNGKFYVHYSLDTSNGISNGIDVEDVDVNNLSSLFQEWSDINEYNHIDVVEEYIQDCFCDNPKCVAEKSKTLLKIRQPFENNNGSDSLLYKEGKLLLTLGDGGSSYDPFNLSQNNNSLHGKIISIDETIVWDETVSIGNIYELDETQCDKVTILSKGIQSPSSLDILDDMMYLVDNGKVVNELNVFKKFGNNFGWRPFEGILPTLHMSNIKNISPTYNSGINPVDFKVDEVVWDVECDKGGVIHLDIAPGDYLHFKSSNPCNVIETFSNYENKKDPIIDSEISIINESILLECTGDFYFKSFVPGGDNTSLSVSVRNDILRKRKVNSIKLENYKDKLKSSKEVPIFTVAYYNESLSLAPKLKQQCDTYILPSENRISSGKYYKGELGHIKDKFVFIDLLKGIYTFSLCEPHIQKINVKIEGDFYTSLGVNDKRDTLYIGTSTILDSKAIGTVYSLK